MWQLCRKGLSIKQIESRALAVYLLENKLAISLTVQFKGKGPFHERVRLFPVSVKESGKREVCVLGRSLEHPLPL
jgi:hypothetical protein